MNGEFKKMVPVESCYHKLSYTALKNCRIY